MEKEQPITSGDPEAVCAGIRREAGDRYRDILDRARREADGIIAAARRELDEYQASREDLLAKEMAAMKERNGSSSALEKKRLILHEKDRFVRDVFARVRMEMDAFRAGRDEYTAFLKGAILEGIAVVGGGPVAVRYSPRDTEFFVGASGDALARECASPGVAPVTFRADTFSDAGVVVETEDGRLRYDNRFSARLARMEEHLYMTLIKEAW